MSSKPVLVYLNLNKTGFSQGVASAQREMRKLQASAQEMGHGTVSSMQASSAAIRVLEGGITGNIRAAERFIGMLPGIGSALKAAFPLVGGIALAGVFVKIGEEAVNFVQKMNDIPKNPFGELIANGKVTNDQLLVANDRLQMEIDKLEHKPVNGMAMALDQARESSDKLFASLLKSNAQFDEAMAKNQIGKVKGLWNNMESTAASTRDISSARAGVSAVTADHQTTIDDALASGNQANVDQAREALMVDLQKAYKAQDEKLRAGLDAALRKQADFKGSYSEGADQAKVIENYRAALAQSASEQTEAGANYGQSKLQQKRDGLGSGGNDNKEQEAIIRQWRRNLEEQKADYDMTLANEARFWVQRMEESRKGSLSYLTALEEVNKDIARMRSESIRNQAEFDKTASGIYGNDFDKGRSDTGDLRESGRDAAEYLKMLNQGITQHQANATAIAEESLRMEVLTGRMSQLGAAQALAAIHAEEYADAQHRVSMALDAANSMPDSLSKQATIAGLSNQSAQMAADHQMQMGRDQQSVSSQQLAPAMQQALGNMVNEWANMSHSIVETFSRGVDSLNDDIVKAMTGRGKAADFGKTFTQAGNSLMKAGLQGAESKLLGLFHLGGLKKADGSSASLFHLGGLKKADGSSASPFYVVMAKQAGGSGASAGIAGSIPSLGGIMGGIGKFIRPFFQGHFATGGDVLANHPAMVGERGPEMFIPRSAGTIVPNHALGGGDTHIHVDARGSNDPAAIHAAVMRAAPSLIAASVQANHQANKRMSRGR